MQTPSPWMQTPRMQTPSPLGCRPPWRQTPSPLNADPLDADPPGCRPPDMVNKQGVHPTGMHSCLLFPILSYTSHFIKRDAISCGGVWWGDAIKIRPWKKASQHSTKMLTSNTKKENIVGIQDFPEGDYSGNFPKIECK